MEKGILILLKALGIEITPEQVAMVQGLIPQLPARLNQMFTLVNSAAQNFDERLRANEDETRKLRLAIESLSSEVIAKIAWNRPDGG